eukprot:CAMPEP_0202434348 /NCGR_PEP_ID=MMETSP1345-20130828/15084_1 /ASSEMBLY_ACC=CAM_ASM_000843 /TAXON_ID=342563 /ORGANISM="Fabrea Fabrea salina" /LENGTH=222 /DNA_ID=CAMNT_0049046999 /DNA_START=169 /DNA_END=834 /DNA_ORIENTATION=-
MKIKPPISIPELQTLNQKLERKASRQQNGSGVPDISQKITQLHSKLDQKISTNDILPLKRAPSTLNDIEKPKKVLKQFTSKKICQEVGHFKAKNTDLVNCFQKLVETPMTPQLLQSTKILKLVKLFNQEFKESPEEEIFILAKTAQKLTRHWEKLKLMPSETPDFESVDNNLRKTVCRKFSRILLEKGVSETRSQELAFFIEKNIRKNDPSMSVVYKSTVRE